ncbi:MAG: PcfJ domain-containing protein [Rhodospirillales bacterium]
MPHVALRAAPAGRARSERLDRRLALFRPEVRAGVLRLASRHARLADLAETFPALLETLAGNRAGIDRAGAMMQVIAGAPLPRAAQTAGVPYWLRRLRPDLLPAVLPALPDSVAFRSRIANHLPQRPRQAAPWFKAVAGASAWADEEIAAWAGREALRLVGARAMWNLRRVCLWAWFSRRAGTRAGALVETAWRPDMSYDRASEEARAWMEAIELLLNLGDRPVADIWLCPAHVDGYDFVPLDSAVEIMREGKAMRNCVVTYGDVVAHGRSRLWRVCRDGEPVATLEIVRQWHNPVPEISSLLGPLNRDVPADVWAAAGRWLDGHDLTGFRDLPVEWGSAPLDRAVWTALWRPYWLARRQVPDWLPLLPTRRALELI